MNKLLLFTDGSVNVQSKVGCGASLVISEDELYAENLVSLVKVKRFENTSSSRLELQTLLWALDNVETNEREIKIHTDSQTIVDLLERRERLEKNDFKSKKNVALNNGELYKAFFLKIDLLTCEFVKIKGHQPTRNKNEIERVFALVDKASRKALRNDSK